MSTLIIPSSTTTLVFRLLELIDISSLETVTNCSDTVFTANDCGWYSVALEFLFMIRSVFIYADILLLFLSI